MVKHRAAPTQEAGSMEERQEGNSTAHDLDANKNHEKKRKRVIDRLRNQDQDCAKLDCKYT